jgi:hypothetical protein
MLWRSSSWPRWRAWDGPLDALEDQRDSLLGDLRNGHRRLSTSKRGGGPMVNAESRGAAAPAVVLAAALGLAAACWAAAAWPMDGTDMGVATRPGSFGFFAGVWVSMLLPGAAPGGRQARPRERYGVCRAAAGRVLPGHLGARRCRGVRAGPAARAGGRRRGSDRGRCLRAHGGQAALPAPSPAPRSCCPRRPPSTFPWRRRSSGSSSRPR